MQSRMSKMKKNTEKNNKLAKGDFGTENDKEVEIEDIFSGLIGCESAIDKLREYNYLINFCKSKGDNPSKYVEFNFVFTGAPGTGKTTVARRMGKMFYSLGLLPTDEVKEVSVFDLITGYVGQSGKKTFDMLTKARGEVLFIDKAI